MNEHCNIFKTIECILENGITAGRFKIRTGIRERVNYYLVGRGFTLDHTKNITVVMNDDGDDLVILEWRDNGLFLDTKYYKHHIVLEIIVLASDLIIRDVLIQVESEQERDEESYEEDQPVDNSQDDEEEDSFTDEWI